MKKSQLYATNNNLEIELNSLSKRAKNLITPPQSDISAILSKMGNSNISTKSFAKTITELVTNFFAKPAISFAAVLLCVLSILYLPDSGKNIKQNSLSTEALLTEIDRDLKFAETIDTLENYVLSGFITLSDNQNYNLDEFIEFVTPTNNHAI